jgi:outer membrane protein
MVAISPFRTRSRVAFASRHCLTAMALALCQDVAAQEKNRIVMGAGVAVLPRFEGSDEYRVEPAPLIDVRQGRFFARTRDGIGVDLVDMPRFTMGVGLNWMQGYDRDDVPDGIGKLSSALGGKVFMSTRMGDVVATLSATQALTKRERGLLVNAQLSYPYEVTGRLSIIPSVSVNWGNAKYMNSYFGVDASRAADSGLPRYEPSAGFKDASFRIAANYQFNKSWSAVSAVGVSRLFNKAGDSPFVQRQMQLRALVGLTYTF